ncbi:DUF2207 domain-containing protein [Halobacillus sp. Marseille-Q1614]|uniref:DUF2207 domain-containing protein n=1 Tax=Halobacillus sp. Marseille-Q1614 TaxID=2709134 RepID=UPI00156FF88C|nr:DUF2207 domain-containing protein [Halobacillus sp. Marseille-Q1614]
MKKLMSGLFLVFLLTLSPIYALAVDFEIDQTEINASLQKDGEVEVKETHTYSFEGEFNGIARSLIPKEGSAITHFRASEGESELKVEQEDELYKVHRSGSDETVTIELFYKIENGMEVYEDVAQFYWPFFDESNESTYENLSITVEPPQSTEVKEAYGYDEAYDTPVINKEGSVTFNLGEVPSDKNGDIRVAYNAGLFSGASLTRNEAMLASIQAEKAELDEQMIARAEQQERWGDFAPYILGFFIVVALALLAAGYRKRQETTREAERQHSGGGRFPKDKMSLPAMLTFMKHGYLSTDSLTSALLDLYRKGNIEKVSDQEFKVVNRNTEYRHERLLIQWLFDEVGDGQSFRVEDIEAYVEEKDNQEKYQKQFKGWREAVKQEYKQYDLYEKSTKTRWASLIAAVAILPFLVVFPIYGLLPWMFFGLMLFIFFIGFAIAYQPLTVLGQRIKYELEPLKKGEEWKDWDKEDQVPALLYQIGFGRRDLTSSPNTLSTGSNNDWLIFLLLAGTINSSFTTAEEHVSAASTTGGMPGGGAGVGGGGGGSGAF